MGYKLLDQAIWLGARVCWEDDGGKRKKLQTREKMVLMFMAFRALDPDVKPNNKDDAYRWRKDKEDKTKWHKDAQRFFMSRANMVYELYGAREEDKGSGYSSNSNSLGEALARLETTGLIRKRPDKTGKTAPHKGFSGEYDLFIAEQYQLLQSMEEARQKAEDDQAAQNEGGLDVPKLCLPHEATAATEQAKAS